MHSPSFLLRWPALLCLLTLGHCAFSWLPVTAHGALPMDDKGWITVPRGFLASRLVRRAGTPESVYRVIINIPADPAAKGQILQGSGDKIVDGIAWDFVKTVLRPARRPAEGDRRYQLKLVSVGVAMAGKIPPKLLAIPDKDYNLPSPPYLADARRRGVEGTCKVRAAFPAAGGRPTEVALMESTGDVLLDAIAVQWAIFRWTAARTGQAHGLVVPIRFVNPESQKHASHGGATDSLHRALLADARAARCAAAFLRCASRAS